MLKVETLHSFSVVLIQMHDSINQYISSMLEF